MAPEMNMQLFKGQSAKVSDQFEDLAQDCSDVNQYMDKIDELMKKL